MAETILNIFLIALGVLGAWSMWKMTDYAPLDDFLKALNIIIKRKAK